MGPKTKTGFSSSRRSMKFDGEALRATATCPQTRRGPPQRPRTPQRMPSHSSGCCNAPELTARRLDVPAALLLSLPRRSRAVRALFGAGRTVGQLAAAVARVGTGRRRPPLTVACVLHAMCRTALCGGMDVMAWLLAAIGCDCWRCARHCRPAARSPRPAGRRRSRANV